eukprot:TRINITY_DN29331_c0_g1_i1.p1 TRINITY_DN29331_c0_g1~~TRINITY_DN29331_c0_g1_i1.p1  ORF type:complete len:231 (-),score=24.29 TRINITY_DN29331_c0_g1_i1:593-1285(-)
MDLSALTAQSTVSGRPDKFLAPFSSPPLCGYRNALVHHTASLQVGLLKCSSRSSNILSKRHDVDQGSLSRFFEGSRAAPSRRSLQCRSANKGAGGSSKEDDFKDVDKFMADRFTFKAVEVVLSQLNEMNPPAYFWFYSYVANKRIRDSRLFIQDLAKERQELAERVMATRLVLFQSWAKKYNHEHMYKAIEQENLELLRERVVQTVKFVSGVDDAEVRAGLPPTPPPEVE